MKRLFFIWAFLATSLSLAAQPLRVVTTTPDLADITRQIGGEHVQVENIGKGYQDPHGVEAKPSFIVKLIKADVFIQTGMELEIAWAPLLLQGSRNKKVLPGGSGYIDASEAITERLEIPLVLSRAEGDVHPSGNPHYLGDPRQAKPVAQLIARRLSQMDPEKESIYQENLTAFLTTLQDRIQDWESRFSSYRGASFVSYHKSFSYLADWLGLVAVGEIEPKPGIPPNASHTANLLKEMEAKDVRLILFNPWDTLRTVKSITKQSNATSIEIALYPEANKNVKTYFEAIEYNIQSLINTLKRS